MCGRYVIFTSSEHRDMASILNEIRTSHHAEFGAAGSVEIYPSHSAPTIRMEQGLLSYTLLRWGIPLNRSKNLINARAETLGEKPMFSRLLPKGRCLLPANGFYEWKDSVKYLIRPETLDTFCFAGLSDPEGRFVIITADASEQMKNIHHRMPVLLDKAAGRIWLEDKDLSRLAPYPGNLLIQKAG